MNHRTFAEHVILAPTAEALHLQPIARHSEDQLIFDHAECLVVLIECCQRVDEILSLDDEELAELYAADTHVPWESSEETVRTKVLPFT